MNCEECPEKSPLIVEGKCIECPERTHYDEKYKVCIQCGGDSFFNPSSGKCEKPQDIAFPECSVGASYDLSQGKCVCPTEKPHDDGVECLACLGTTFWNETEKKCTTCPGDLIYNESSQSCTEPPIVCPYNKILSSFKFCQCPAATPYDTGYQCINCEEPTFWNSTEKKCVMCSDNRVYNEFSGECVSCPKDSPI